jgi:hypothetical protein
MFDHTGGWLERKYKIQESQAAAENAAKYAAAQLAYANAASTPVETAARAAALYGQANHSNATADTLGPLAKATIGGQQYQNLLNYAHAGLLNAQAAGEWQGVGRGVGAQSGMLKPLSSPIGGGAAPAVYPRPVDVTYLDQEPSASNFSGVEEDLWRKNNTSFGLGAPRATLSQEPLGLPRLTKPLPITPVYTPTTTSSVSPLTEDRTFFNNNLYNKPAAPVAPAVDPNDKRGQLYNSYGISKGSTGYKKGITRVPGKGDGTKDTVKGKRLAPGEAVLNKAAADMIGRGLITHANKAGAQQMGLV